MLSTHLYRRNGTLNDSLSGPFTVITWEKDLRVSPFLKGDFKHPLTWSYTIVESQYVRGFINLVNLGNPAGSSFRSGDFGIGWTYFMPTESLVANKMETAFNVALSKLYDQIRGDSDLSIDAFQARQNIRMVKALRNVPKIGNLLKAASSVTTALKGAGSKWLEYQYGWKPVVQDIYFIADESIRVVINKIENYKASCTLPFQDSSAFDIDSFGRNTQFNQIKGKVTVKFGVACSVPDFDLARWTSLNPVSIAWELLPYSFVVDWFYNVGGMLRSLETALLYNQRFQYGYVTRFVTYDEFVERRGSFHSPFGIDISIGLVGSGKRTSMNRTPLSAMPTPYLPHLNVSFNSWRLANAAGLLSQFLGRK